jgi:hypothetical protein
MSTVIVYQGRYTGLLELLDSEAGTGGSESETLPAWLDLARQHVPSRFVAEQPA